MEYTNSNRGIFQFQRRARQLIDFEGMRYKNITPTDIDAYTEYQDRAFLFFEFKYGDAKMSYGQETALTRNCDAIQETGRDAVVFECHHNVQDCWEDVLAYEVPVTRYYYKKKWRDLHGMTAGQCYERFLKWVDRK